MGLRLVPLGVAVEEDADVLGEVGDEAEQRRLRRQLGVGRVGVLEAQRLEGGVALVGIVHKNY